MLRTDPIAPIGELLRRQADARGTKTAFADARRAVTYGELLRRTGNLAGHLADLGIGRGESVALLLPNCVEWLEACLAISRAGAVGVPIGYESTQAEILYRLGDAGCRGVITTDERAELIARLRCKLPTFAAAIFSDRSGTGGDGPRFSRLAEVAPAAQPRDPTNIDQPAYILYTSGTTGRAKGVLLSIRGMLWVTAACWAPICQLSERDNLLSPLPLFHSYALNLSALSVVATGASAFIMERFSTDEALARLQGGAYTLMPGVPTMFHYLLQRAREEMRAEPTPGAPCRSGAGAARLAGVRQCISAGAIMPATLNREFERVFAVPLLDGYGITETSTMVTLNEPIGGRIMGSCGLPLPGLAVRIVDPATGRDLDPGGEGELIVRGPNVMSGYHNKPEETRAALRDGWYHTGDLARSDENGFLTITGRLKELIIRGGQNIAPAEIEEVVGTFESVLDCAVIGIPHPHLGEVPALFVVARPGCSIETERLIAHCRRDLSGYKIPQTVHLIEQIPRTGSGKIMRYKLRERLSELEVSEDSPG